MLLNLKITKCFGMCGCSATTNGQCINCNSTYFLGYDNPQSISPLSPIAPDTDGTNCSINNEYIDVR